MPSLRKTGVFADSNSSDGLFRGIIRSGESQATPVLPAWALSNREAGVLFQDFIVNDDVVNYVDTEIGTSGVFSINASDVNGSLGLASTTANQGFGSFQFDDGSVDNAAAFIRAATDRVVVFEARVSLALIDDCDWFVGIGEVDTTFLSASGALLANGADNHCGFHHLLADAGVPTMSSAGTALANVDSTQVGSGIGRGGSTVSHTLPTDSSYIRFGFRIQGTTGIEFYVDNKLVHTRTSTAAFDTQMTPTFALIANGSALSMDIDYVLVAQTR